MAEELQSLLDKINAEGINKAKAEADKIIADAESKAKAIIEAARNEAAALTTAAGKEAENFKQRAIAAAGQAARDITLQLRSELQLRMEKACGDAAAAALTPEFMAQLIRELAAKFAESPDAQLTVRCALRDTEALTAALKAALADSFSKEPKLIPTAAVTKGFEVDFKDGKCFFDFSADAIADLLKEYVGEQIAVIFNAE